VVLRERSAYRAAWPLGKGVTETEPSSKAAREILELRDWINVQLQVCTPEGVQGERAAVHG
jgi:chromosome partitioning protein